MMPERIGPMAMVPELDGEGGTCAGRIIDTRSQFCAKLPGATAEWFPPLSAHTFPFPPGGIPE